MKLKINTVVSEANWKEDLNDFILEVNPLRWKLFQVLSVPGQNSTKIDRFQIDEEQFWAFVQRHERVARSGISLVPENNTAMRGSYAMVDPAGRFYDYVGSGGYTYSESILDVGVAEAISQVRISRGKFLARGGLYDAASQRHSNQQPGVDVEFQRG